MSQSILDSVKKILGLPADYDAFDQDVIMHINSTFLAIQQLGVGPSAGFMIEGSDETWEDLLGGDPNLNAVKTLVGLKVRLIFDPPTTSFAIEAMERQIAMYEYRINLEREQYIWTPPVPPDPDEIINAGVLDGGAP